MQTLDAPGGSGARRAAGRELRTSHEKLAQRLGASRETVSRALKAFEGNGRVRLGRGVIVVTQPQALPALAGEAAASVTPVTERGGRHP